MSDCKDDRRGDQTDALLKPPSKEHLFDGHGAEHDQTLLPPRQPCHPGNHGRWLHVLGHHSARRQGETDHDGDENRQSPAADSHDAPDGELLDHPVLLYVQVIRDPWLARESPPSCEEDQKQDVEDEELPELDLAHVDSAGRLRRLDDQGRHHEDQKGEPGVRSPFQRGIREAILGKEPLRLVEQNQCARENRGHDGGDDHRCSCPFFSRSRWEVRRSPRVRSPRDSRRRSLRHRDRSASVMSSH